MEAIHTNPERDLNVRMAGYHYSVVCTGEVTPSSLVVTYPVKIFETMKYNFLVKLMPCLSIDNEIIFPTKFKDIKVEDFPGGVEASFRYENTWIQTRITPLLIGRGSDTWKGAALYEVQTSPAKEVIIYLGIGESVSFFDQNDSSLNNDSVIGINEVNFIKENTISFKSGKEGLNVVINSSETITLNNTSSSLQIASIHMQNGSGYVLTGFSDNADDLHDLSQLDVLVEKKKVFQYYEDLLKTTLETPEPVMNQAFTTALYNLEYSWFEPFGWGECMHHWLALWHMQVGAAADLIGQTERSKSCIFEHAYHLYDNGAVPQFQANKLIKRDFGGSNQYWVWQVRHYLNYSGDKEFAKLIIPYVDAVINQTLEEYDRDGDFLASWGLQIGNQEDFVANPYNGAVPSIELYNMFMTRAELSGFINDTMTANQWYQKADYIKSQLYKELWINDLGRFAYYKDPTGIIMPDAQYQTYLYPIIYDIVDEYDQYAGLRHLRDRLTGEDGAVFLSNNFSWHAYGTWGMQCGEAQQPWAAAGFSKAGLNNETWRPLNVMAKWAQDINHRGSWPEIGPEPTPAYFTPPAGLYIVAVTEALFGINVNSSKGYVEISPSFPDHWPQAKLNLPDFQVNYSRKQNRLEYILSTTKNLPLKINWRLPVSKIKMCTVNNTEVCYTIKPGVNHIILNVDVPVSIKTTIIIEYEPVDYSVIAPRSIAGGEEITVSIVGAGIERIIDRYGVLESISVITASFFSAKVQTRLLDSYLKFNQLGLLNFSRRTFFMDCKTYEGIPFIVAIDMNILPRFEASVVEIIEQKNNGLNLKLKLRNNTNEAYQKNSEFVLAGTRFGTAVSLLPRSEQVINIDIPSDLKLLPGDNNASLVLPGEIPVNVYFTFNNFQRVNYFVPIELPEKDMIPDSSWNTIRVMPGFPHIFFTFTNYGWPMPMCALKDINEIEVKQIKSLKFKIPEQQFIPVSHLSGNVSYKINLEKKIYKKLFMLVLPFVDNHNMFSTVARLSAYSKNEIVYSRTLCYPGDLDYWVPDKNPTSFATFREPRADRFELLPLLDPNKQDWNEGKPPAFPQPKWWATCLPVVTESCLMSVIEINLKKPESLDCLIFEALGTMPAFGIVAITAVLSEE